MRDTGSLSLSLAAHCPPDAMRSALRLRGGLQSLLWGGDLPRDEFVHSVLLGLLANSLAMHLCTIGTDWLCARVRPHASSSSDDSRGQLLRRLSSSVLWHLATLAAGFVTYLLVFRLTGFVPMGYVMGTRPAIPLFEPPVVAS